MKINYSTLKNCILFKDILEKDYENILHCLNAYTKKYKKDSIIINESDEINNIGIVLSGSLQIVKIDFFGNQDILTNVYKNELFGESFAATGASQMQVTILSKEDCEILFINFNKLTKVCHKTCIFHTKLIQNMLEILAKKNILLMNKIEHMSRKTIKEKLLSYLSSEAIYLKTNSFDIPFNRQELANYLSIDRSAMCSQLSKLKKAGIISFNKNHFSILNKNSSIYF